MFSVTTKVKILSCSSTTKMIKNEDESMLHVVTINLDL